MDKILLVVEREDEHCLVHVNLSLEGSLIFLEVLQILMKSRMAWRDDEELPSPMQERFDGGKNVITCARCQARLGRILVECPACGAAETNA